MKKRIHLAFALLVVFALMFVRIPGASGAGALPAYYVQFLGEGSVVAINNLDSVAGFRIDPVSGVYVPLVSVSGGAWQTLPLPAGWEGAFPTDLNNSGVIVGVATHSHVDGRRAVRWTPTESGYAVAVLPLLPGEQASYATAINDLGQIVGARAGILGTPYGFGWLYTDAEGMIDLNARYGWFATPNDINDNGLILSGTQTFDLATQTLTDVGLSGPANYNAVGGVSINNAGQIVGSASLRSSSLNIISVFRYSPASGWEFISGTSKYTIANDINNLGDLCWGEMGAGIYLNGLGGYPLNNLLDPSEISAGWTITGNGCVLNDQIMVATFGRNSLTGEAGAVLLTPNGTLPPPTAPVNLQGVSHTATRMEPYNSINLTWENTSPLTKSYEIERRESGGTTWTLLSMIPPGTATHHTDTTVGVGILYEYRVRAVGLGGASLWSETISVEAPTIPLDTEAPVVSILNPPNGASVSGTVTVTAHATDNVAVEYLEIKYWNQYLGQEIILGSVNNNGSLSVNWNTSGLTPATYTVSAYAYDSLGNWTQTDITVNVASGKALRSTAISLSGRASGTKVNLTGSVTIKDAFGKSVSGARVSALWTLPDGSTRLVYANTDSLGRARFTTSGGRGTYTLTVLNVTKVGYFFDPLASILSQSITK